MSLILTFFHSFLHKIFQLYVRFFLPHTEELRYDHYPQRLSEWGNRQVIYQLHCGIMSAMIEVPTDGYGSTEQELKTQPGV